MLFYCQDRIRLNQFAFSIFFQCWFNALKVLFNIGHTECLNDIFIQNHPPFHPALKRSSVPITFTRLCIYNYWYGYHPRTKVICPLGSFALRPLLEDKDREKTPPFFNPQKDLNDQENSTRTRIQKQQKFALFQRNSTAIAK